MTVGGPPMVVHSERWTEPVFGEGPTSGYDHVVLTGPGVTTAGPISRSGQLKYIKKKKNIIKTKRIKHTHMPSNGP
jgi:hypothetical protein